VNQWGSGKKRICGCCVRIRTGGKTSDIRKTCRAGISVRVRIRVRDGVRISNRVSRRVKLVNYSLITALPIAISAYPLFTCGRINAIKVYYVASCSIRYGHRGVIHLHPTPSNLTVILSVKNWLNTGVIL